mgnify:CR=1 FL=1
MQANYFQKTKSVSFFFFEIEKKPPIKKKEISKYNPMIKKSHRYYLYCVHWPIQVSILSETC